MRVLRTFISRNLTGGGQPPPFRKEVMKDEIIDNTAFFQHNKDGDYTIQQNVVQDISGILKQNYLERENSNGFSEGRTMRKVMSLSTVDYLNALKMGYALDCADPVLLRTEVRRYLKEVGRDKGYQTVKHILTPGKSANIIIK